MNDGLVVIAPDKFRGSLTAARAAERIAAGVRLAVPVHGKASAGVAEAAAREGIPVVAVAGRIDLTEREWRNAGLAAVYSLTELAGSSGESIHPAGELAELAGLQLAVDFL
jgi:glycerate 2-kinase